MSIFTKIGDKGKTKMFNGNYIEKTCSLIEFLSVSDDTCGCISKYISELDKKHSEENKENKDFILTSILHKLFILNAFVSSYADSFENVDYSKFYILPENGMKNLEEQIKSVLKNIPKQTKFIQHCSDDLYLSANLCRTKIRLLEIQAWKVEQYLKEKIEDNVNAHNYIKNFREWCSWLNRLSNYFYNMSVYHTLYSDSEIIYFNMN